MSDKTLKIALFDFHGIEVVHSDSEEWVQKSSEYTQLSEFVEVTFPALPDEEVLKNKVAGIDQEIEELKNEFLEKMNRLNTAKQELLALEHKS